MSDAFSVGSLNWARSVFAGAQLGDSRRTDRLILMASRAAARPGGKISEVLLDAAERQGAYDFLEGAQVLAAPVLGSVANAAFRCAEQHPFCFAAVDGSSLSLTDTQRKKGFGTVGSTGIGLKVITSLLVSPEGVLAGIADQQWWARPARPKISRRAHRQLRLKARPHQKETRHWLQAIEQTCQRAQQSGVQLWFQLDREGDNRDYLSALAKCGHRFTVRGNWNRLVESFGTSKHYLREVLGRHKPIGSYELDVPAGPGRRARRAKMTVRAAKVTLLLRDKWMKTATPLTLTAVITNETRTPKGEKPLDWMLLTNAPVTTLTQAQEVIHGYAQRWRIEEFHKTWKTGACKSEETQLRSVPAVITWATILAAVATRIERLKRLSRTEPDKPANIELSKVEIRALLLLRREVNHRKEIRLNAMPTIEQATLWIAELGGYTGKSSGGPPGAITIRRGLEYLRPAAQLLESLGPNEK
jgi:hypothetical protein